jgi:hypothetical protein
MREASAVVFLQHGLWGYPYDLAAIGQALSTTYPDLTCVLLDCNVNNTEDGIANGGRRCMEEIKTACSALTSARLSFVGHSLGGLYLVAALAEITRENPHFFDPPFTLQNVILLASPLLGLTGCNPWYIRMALAVVPGQTYRDLGMKSHFLLSLIDADTVQLLNSFRGKFLFGNLTDDVLVSPFSALLLPDKPEAICEWLAKTGDNFVFELPQLEISDDEPTKSRNSWRSELRRRWSQVAWRKFGCVYRRQPLSYPGRAHVKIVCMPSQDKTRLGIATVNQIIELFGH